MGGQQTQRAHSAVISRRNRPHKRYVHRFSPFDTNQRASRQSRSTAPETKPPTSEARFHGQNKVKRITRADEQQMETTSLVLDCSPDVSHRGFPSTSSISTDRPEEGTSEKFQSDSVVERAVSHIKSYFEDRRNEKMRRLRVWQTNGRAFSYQILSSI